jgi:hypothetical protein
MWLISFCSWLAPSHFACLTIKAVVCHFVRQPVFQAKSRPEVPPSSPFEVETRSCQDERSG